MGIFSNISKKEQTKTYVWAIYILQFFAIFTVGLSFLLSGFLAYVKYDENIGSLEESHLQWQIKTFWVSLAGLILGILLVMIFIGKIILLLTQLWLTYRVVKGSFYFFQGKGVDTDGFF